MNQQISTFLQDHIDRGDFPSAVYLVAEKGEIVFQDALGFAVVDPERIEANVDTIYDLASLTKVLVTGLCAAYFFEDEEFRLDDRVSKFLPQFDTDEKRETSIRELLTHTSGYASWLPLYLRARNLSHLTEAVASVPNAARAGTSVIYSDLNFITLANIVEKIKGAQIDMIAGSDFFDKIGLTRTFFCPLKTESNAALSEIAASEKGNEYEKQTCIELGYLQPPAYAGGTDRNPVAVAPGSDSFFRKDVIWGEVHDGNAWFMGGIAGHAGLFSTSEEVFKIALQFLPDFTKLLKPRTCELFRTNFTPGMNENRSFAFQLASTKDSTAGTKMSPESFGHNGFTGTSLWIDPDKERIFVLLTNRTHHHPLPFVNINSVRRHFHDLTIDLLDKNR